jgi:hypothetical protein
LDVEAKTIAESRMILDPLDILLFPRSYTKFQELEEREVQLKDLHLELKRDIRYVEAIYIKRKRELNQAFNQVDDLPKKRFAKKKESRVAVLKKLEKEKQEVIGPYYQVCDMAEQLLCEMDEAKKPLQDFVIDKMGL